VYRPFRKPLVVLSPKSPLRHPRSVSTLEEFTAGGFQTVLADPRGTVPAGVERVLVCSGKIFFALAERRDANEQDDTAIIRLEQLYPFPAAELAAAIGCYARATEVSWVQEEPANQGVWSFVRWPIAELLGAGRTLRYIGRPEAASPATGSYQIHQAEERAILEEALRPRAAEPSPRRRRKR